MILFTSLHATLVGTRYTTVFANASALELETLGKLQAGYIHKVVLLPYFVHGGL